MTSICLRGILIYRSELQIEPWGTRVRPAVEKGRPGTIVLSSMVFCALLRKRSKRQQLIQKSETLEHRQMLDHSSNNIISQHRLRDPWTGITQRGNKW